MFYFIPSWYNAHRKWYDSAVSFYQQKDNREFDDTIHQLRLFKSANEDITTLVLNYSPNLRYLLHRQRISDIPVISIFDLVQNINEVTYKILNINDFNWDNDVEFIYTPFLVTATKNGKKYANILFTDQGTIMSIIFFEDELPTKNFVFDDRGFLSSILYFEDGKESFQDYLNLSGQWVIRENLFNGTVVVNTNIENNFNKQQYANIEELIIEKLSKIFVDSSNNIIVSANEVHNDLIFNVAKDNNIVLSFYEDRMSLDNKEMLNDIVSKAKFVVVNNPILESQLKEIILEQRDKEKIENISIYDTRLELGKSQRKKELITYIHCDNHNNDELKELLKQMFYKIQDNKNISLVLGTYGKIYKEKDLLKLVDNLLIDEFEEKLKRKVKDKNKFENNFEIFNERKHQDVEIDVAIINNEIDLINTLEYVRLIFNLGSNPDTLSTITGISSGIPQVNSVETKYVVPGKNGMIIKDFSEIGNVIDYYYVGLENWNKSLVYSVQQILKYTGSELVKQWKKRLED